MKSHENSWKFKKVHEISWFSWGEPQLPLRRPLNISPWSHSFSRPRHRFFLCAATCHVFAMRRAVNAGTASKRARDPHVLALHRIVERSYSQGFMIFNVRLSCNFVFMQGIHLEIRFSVFAVKFSRSETFKPGRRPLSKERAHDQTYFRNHALWKIKQLKLHDFTKLNCIAPVVHMAAQSTRSCKVL